MLPRPKFQELIDKKARWQVEQFLFGRENDERPTLQIKRFIEGIISADYHGRTLIELIQNAHDAHDRDADDGRICVLLDETEGDHGTLYVANAGHPLTEPNFVAMVDVAVSDKPPSEGIGNKGVGFKSVLQFCDCPEVYSRSDDASAEFDGFTFRFGRPDDFAVLASLWRRGDVGLASELERSVSTLTLTFPLEAAPDRVRELGTRTSRDAGYCTVIRLPLKSARALEDARTELLAVADSVAPMHLFLDRIETVHLVTIGPNAQPSSDGAELDEHWFPAAVGPDGRRSLALTRLDQEIDSDRRVALVLLQDDSEFIVARRSVPEPKVLEAIAATRAAGAYLPGWDDWTGDAEVVLALSAGGPLTTPRLYNFLPMGAQVPCPLPAYLQAPFFSSLDRRSLNEAYPINGLFLDEVAELAADLLIATTDGEVDLPTGTLVDLGCWSDGHLPRLAAALERRGRPLDELAYLPSLAEAPSRVSVAKGSLWEAEGLHFSPENLVPEYKNALIDPTLGRTRLGRLADLYKALGHGATWRPTNATLVAYAENCAHRLHSNAAAPEAWAGFYDELSDSVPRNAPVAGALIVSGKNHLLPANGAPGNPTVFFPPKQGDAEARMQPPEAVAGRLAYVRDDIPWRLQDQSYGPGREWLASWVADFGSEEILRVVAEVMTEPDLTENQLTECLIYAFDVWRNSVRPLGEDSFPSKTFRVPTAGGWIPADEAFFGGGWDGDDAWIDTLLVRLVGDSGDASEINDLATRILEPPSSWLPEDLPGGIRQFLERAGVRHGLWPFEVTPASWTAYGSAINHPEYLSARNLPSWVPKELRDDWLVTAVEWERHWADYPTVEYGLTRITRLPGQLEWSRLSARAREIYGELVLAGLDRWKDLDLEARFYRAASRATATWPSFVVVFLMTAEWLPQTVPGDRASVRLAQANDAWWVDGDVPDYLPAPAPHLRRSIGPTAVDRLRKVGVRHWDGQDSASQRIDYLAGLIDAEGAWIRGTRAEYERSWSDYLTRPNLQSPDGVLVEKLGAVELANLSNDGELIYYAVPDDPRSILLGQLPIARLGFTDRALARRVGDHLAQTAPQRFRSVAHAEIRVDWTPPTREGPLLEVIGGWLETLVLLVLSHQQGVAGRRPRQLEQATAQLRAAQLLIVDGFSTSVDGHQVVDSLGQTSCWVVCDGEGSVVVRDGHGRSQLKLAERAAEGIAQAVDAPRAFKDLRLALVDLQDVVRGGSPSSADLAAALRLPLAEVELMGTEREAWRPDMSALVAVLATTVPDVAEELRGSDHVPEDRDDLHAWLASRLIDAPLDAGTLLSYADSAWTTGPIEEGHVSLRYANEGLRLLGLQPATNTEAHVRDFVAFIAAHRAALIDDLRDRFVGRVDPEHEPPASYAALLELPGISIDLAWADEYWRVPQEVMADRAEQWLLDVAGPPVERTLPTVEELRSRQRQRVTNTLTTARDSVLTWCELNEVNAPLAIDVAAVSAKVRSSGFLDFGERTSEGLLAWLKARGHWPEPMPLTLSQKELGITLDDVRQARERRRRELEEAKRRESAITFEGRTFTAEPDDLLRLDEAITDALAEVDLGGWPTLERLDEMPPSPHRGKGKGTPGPKPRKPSRAPLIPQAKTQTIGLAGELFAGHWIRSNFGLTRDETWRSGCRNDILGDELGDDSLGYDFEVLNGDITYLIEVKATTGGDTAFQLPESEIRRALDLAPHERYTILFVTNVLDSALRRFHWLPNPLGPDARLFRVESREMRFSFDVADGDPGEPEATPNLQPPA